MQVAYHKITLGFFFAVAHHVAVASIGVSNLTVEAMTTALGIDATKPRLSWQMTGNGRGMYQSAYQILVSSSQALLDEGTGDLWDSGKIASSQSLDIRYAGKELVSRQRCYWKVRVWDDKGRISAYSKPHLWEIGLLDGSDWRAQWISAPKVQNWAAFAGNRERGKPDTLMNAAPSFRKEFMVRAPVALARLYISGIGYNETYINGQKVGDHVLDPAFTRYDKTVLYQTYDVSPLLNNGENALGVLLGNGWYNMPTRTIWAFDQAGWRARPALLAQLEITYPDGSVDVIATDGTWETGRGAIYFNSVFQGEYYDARNAKRDWNRVGFEDGGWSPAERVSGPLGRLKPQLMPPIRELAEIKPVAITEPIPGHRVYDLGKNISGYVRLKITAPAGTEVVIKYGERLTSDGLVDQEHIGMYAYDTPFQTDRYIAAGRGGEVWNPRFTYHGFQYMEITGLPDDTADAIVTAVVVHTDFSPAGSFHTSSHLLNTIHANTQHSFLTNFHGYPEDCPHREKNGWMGDAHLAAEMAFYNYDVAHGYAKWLEDIADEQRPSGEVPGIVPTAGWGYFFGNGPAWDCSLFLIPWYMYLYTGDLSIIEKQYPSIQQYIDFLATKANEHHIVAWGLGDWCPAKTETPADITSTAYYFKGAEILSKMASLLGDSGAATRYARLAEDIKKSFNRQFYRGNGVYGNGSQTALSCAVYQGLAGEYLTETVDALVKLVKNNNYHLDCGILGTKYLINALMDNGHADVAYRIVSQRTYPSWGYWVEQGATTLWERWDGENSRNHPFFGEVGAWFYKALGGLRIDEDNPGFRNVKLNPIFPMDLDWVDVHHASRYGTIRSSWKREGKYIHWEVNIPNNTTATVSIPVGKQEEVREGGKAIRRNTAGINVIRETDHMKVMDLASGRYAFTFVNVHKTNIITH